MGLRTVLYGYRVENLGFAIESKEAEIVRKIFGEYISGMTLKEIADCLTTDKIVYYKDKCNMDKKCCSNERSRSKYLCCRNFECICKGWHFIRKHQQIKAVNLKTFNI